MRTVLRTPESMWLTVPAAASRSTIAERSHSTCRRLICDQSNAVASVTAWSVKIATALSSARRAGGLPAAPPSQRRATLRDPGTPHQREGPRGPLRRAGTVRRLHTDRSGTPGGIELESG